MRRKLCLVWLCVALLAGTAAGQQQVCTPSGCTQVSAGMCRGCGARFSGGYTSCPNCGRGAAVCPPQGMAPGAAAPGEVTAPPASPEDAAAAPGPGALAGTFGPAAGPASSTPNMIGDFFGGGYYFTGFSSSAPSHFPGARIALAGADRNFKIVEGNSPIPRDRVFGSYNHFNNALPAADLTVRDLDRYIFGVEKTFLCDLASFELRAPVVGGLNSVQVQDDTSGNVTDIEFGNLALAFKGLLLDTPHSKLGAGVGIVFPTGSNSLLDLSLPGVGRTGDYAYVGNDAVHVQPFVGYLWTPNDCFFSLFFAQADFDTNGNEVAIEFRGDWAEGRVQDPALLFLDWSVGYYVYKNPCAPLLRGVAPIAEIHYSTTMQDFDSVTTSGGAGVTGGLMDGPQSDPDRRRDTLNLTGGLQFDLLRSTRLITACVVPLNSGGKSGFDNRDFDAEFVVQLSHYY